MSHGLCLGSRSCQDLVTRVTQCSGFVFARSGMQFPGSLLHPRPREVGDGSLIFTQGAQTLLALELSHGEWDACLSVSLVLGLWPWATMLG